jgi:hypothetical protein
MTDTLRTECEALVRTITTIVPSEDSEYWAPDMLEKIMAFARAQQAKGLREALREYEQWRKSPPRERIPFGLVLKAQATAREKEL